MALLLGLGGVSAAIHPALGMKGQGYFVEGMSLIVSLVAASAVLRRAIASPLSERKGWYLLTLAAAAQGASHVLGLLYLTFPPAPPMPTGQLWFQIAVQPLLIAAIGQWHLGPTDPGPRRRCALDGVIFGASVFFLCWQAGLRQMAMTTSTTPLGSAAQIASFLILAGAFAYWVYLVLPGGRSPVGPTAWVGAFLAGGTLGNITTCILVLRGDYRAGHPLDIYVYLVTGTLWMAALDPRPVLAGGESEVQSHPSAARELLPYAPLFLGIGVVGLQMIFARERLDWMAMGLGALICLLLILRQFLALRDLRRFSGHLEEMVQERTESLGRAQELLLRTERMNTLATLGAGLAHDLKNLLGVISNYTLLLDAAREDGTPPEPGDILAIRDASRQASDLARQLMTMGREEAQPVGFELREKAGALVSLLRAALPGTISFQFKPGPTALWIQGVPAQVDQILVNLVLNARDAIQGRGTIEVSLAQGAMEDGSPSARLQVKDTGQGMSPEVLARIGDPFFTTKGPEQGTGLGLASIKSLVSRMEGHMEVTSEPGVGTTFTLSFPLDQAAAG